QRIARRTLEALENIEFPLHQSSLIVASYTAYLFRRLQEAADQAAESEDEVRASIERWQHGEILREQLTKRLKEMGLPAVGPLADLLFDAPEDHESAGMAIETLAAIRSSSSARVLAHAILEPILPEDLEMKTY